MTHAGVHQTLIRMAHVRFEDIFSTRQATQEGQESVWNSG